MTVHSESGRAWTWSTDETTVYAVDDHKLAIYSREMDTAWLAAEHPVTLREWR